MNKRAAFSLIELLAVIAIIGILVAIALPAVQSSRESARRLQCLNNIHQLGIALQNYHDQHQVLPPSVIWGGPPGETISPGVVGTVDRIALGLAPSSEPSRVYANWLIMLLPQLGEQALHRKYDSHVPVSDSANREVRTTSLAVLNCPSDSYNTPGALYHRDQLAGTSDNFYARGNYAMNFGPDRFCVIELDPTGCTDGFHVGSTDLANENMLLWGSGIGGVNKSFDFGSFTRGLTQTIGVDEIRAGIRPVDPRGSWAFGFIGASITARHGLTGGTEDAYGPNHLNPSADDIVGCAKLHEELTVQGLVDLGMPCHTPSGGEPEQNFQATARSQHPGGVVVMMMDGSAQFINDTINPGVWYDLHLREEVEASSPTP